MEFTPNTAGPGRPSIYFTMSFPIALILIAGAGALHWDKVHQLELREARAEERLRAVNALLEQKKQHVLERERTNKRKLPPRKSDAIQSKPDFTGSMAGVKLMHVLFHAA